MREFSEGLHPYGIWSNYYGRSLIIYLTQVTAPDIRPHTSLAAKVLNFPS